MIYSYKGYMIKPHAQYPNNYIVVTEGKGGKIPEVLNTLFTSTGIAKREVDAYLAKKVKVNEEVNQG